MFIKPCYRKSKGIKLAYWTLVESYRTARGPRHRIVAYLGQLKESQRKGIKHAAEQKGKASFVQTQLFDNRSKNRKIIEQEQTNDKLRTVVLPQGSRQTA